MPYIKHEQRADIDPFLGELITRVQGHKQADRDGILNYLISNLVADSIHPDGGSWRYSDIARAVAVFECAKLEFYRRVAAPKEDDAIAFNGDIAPYQKL